MKPITYLIFSIIIISCNTVNKQSQHDTIDLKGKESPELIAPGIINQGMYVRDFTMTPDQKELYFSVSVGRFTYSHIACSKQINGEWTDPELLSFANNPTYKYFEPHISPDGKHFFFVSNQTEGTPGKELKTDIWVAEREENGWGMPHKLDSTINTEASEFFPSVTRDGTIYFTREDTETRRSYIYRSRFDGEKYLPAERLPEQVNAGTDRFNATIAADESFIIVPIWGMEDSFGSVDYYVCFRNENDQWSNSINLGEPINTDSGEEYSVSFSPDGKTMYFMSARTQKPDKSSITFAELKSLYSKPGNGNANIYKINTEFMEELKQQARFN